MHLIGHSKQRYFGKAQQKEKKQNTTTIFRITNRGEKRRPKRLLGRTYKWLVAVL